jgi:hypothetical protein
MIGSTADGALTCGFSERSHLVVRAGNPRKHPAGCNRTDDFRQDARSEFDEKSREAEMTIETAESVLSQ